MTDLRKSWTLHLSVLLTLFLLQFLLPAYHHGNLARIMVLATYAMGYNILFGYSGLLSLGHALFFAACMYGMGLAMTLFYATVPWAMLVGLGDGWDHDQIEQPVVVRAVVIGADGEEPLGSLPQADGAGD